MLADSIIIRPIGVPLLAFSMLLMTGCGGCRDDDAAVTKKDEDEAKKKIEKKKPDFENRLPVLLPAVFPRIETEPDEEEEAGVDKEKQTLAKKAKEESLIFEAVRKNRTKLGHWPTAYFQVIANNYDASGDLITSSVEGLGKPIPILSTDYFITTTRPASLAKGEWKSLEASIYLPRRTTKTSAANIDYDLRNSTTGLSMLEMIQPTSLMKPFQYHIVVLSNRSQAYNYMGALDSVTINETMSSGEMFPPFYYVVPTRPDDPVPLPRQALNWTTIAYVVWDDFTPDQLDENQQLAMLDWIHQGGQLILSGPDSLDKLRGSFLADYLPAEFESTFNMSNSDVEQLNEYWSVPVKGKPAEKRTLIISDTAPVVGVKFKPHPDANFVDNTGEIVIERRVGRGRIVATVFSLDDQQIRQWRSFNSFFNGCLLRRPPRQFGTTLDTSITFRWANDNTSIFDPLLGSSLRYLSRDLVLGGTPDAHKYQSVAREPVNPWGYGAATYFETPEEEFLLEDKSSSRTFKRDKSNIWRYGGYADDIQSGTAGWNDAGAVSQAARETLKQAAGISPPSSSFVLKMLAVYLVVLVPLNWLVFKSMGKVEWAWIAAPIIAVAGAFTVVKMASLDIGFVRSNTQIGLLELCADYPRGHMVEYSALYTSLSTGYDVELDNLSAQTLPFAANLGERFKPKETLSRVTLDRSRENRLRGFQVQSNSTGMLHSEYTVDVGGKLSLEQDDQGNYAIVNSTRIDVDGAAVVHRDENGDYHVGKVGLLKSGDRSKPLQFKSVTKTEVPDCWLDNPEFASSGRRAKQIWEQNLGESTKIATVETISEFPEVASQWAEFAGILRARRSGQSIENLVEQTLHLDEFDEIMRQLSGHTGINVGRMFDVIVDNLELEPGEMRLIGHTDKSIGATRFVPESTQTEQQTLIVVHLKKGKLPPALPDVNAMADFAGPANLDNLLDD